MDVDPVEEQIQEFEAKREGADGNIKPVMFCTDDFLESLAHHIWMTQAQPALDAFIEKMRADVAADSVEICGVVLKQRGAIWTGATH